MLLLFWKGIRIGMQKNFRTDSKGCLAGKTSLQELLIPQNQTFEEVIEIENIQIKIPEELYNSLKALGYQDRDIY